MKHLTDGGFKSAHLRMMPAGTVLFTSRAPIGKVAIAGAEMCCNQGFKCLVCSERVNNEWLCRLLQFKTPELNSMGTGATFKELSKRAMADYEIRIPSLELQRDEVEKLIKIETSIAFSELVLDKLGNLVKSEFAEMFGDPNLSQQRETWRHIGDLCKVVGGATPKTAVEEYWDGDLPWITPAEIKGNDKTIYDTQRKLTEAGARSASMSQMPIGTVILSSRAPIGKVAIAGIEMYCNQGFKNLICGPEVLPGYLYELLRENTDYLNSLGRGATFKELSKKAVENTKIPVPDIERQREFIDFAAQIDKLEFKAQAILELVKSLV